MLNKLLARTDPDPLDFSPPLLRLQDTPPAPFGRAVVVSLASLLGALILWAALGQLDIVAVAEGKLVPQSYLKIVQPAESGIVKEILVKEGETVRAGQVLMRMDTLVSDADAKTLDVDSQRKRMTVRRIDAELSNRAFRIESDDPSALAREIEAQYRANRAALEAAKEEERSRLVKGRHDLASAEQIRAKLIEVLPHYREQDKAYEAMSREGYAASIAAGDKRRERIEKEQELKTQEFAIEAARATILQSEKKLAQIESDYRRQLFVERNENQGAADKLSQEIVKQTHKQNLLELRAPQDCLVKDLATHTVGTVVQPGTVLLTLVPREDALRAEVWISNDDIGFVRKGQAVKVKLMAFPFQKFGMVDGTVEYVSADAADGNTANGHTLGDNLGDKNPKVSPALYRALIALNAMQLEMDGERFKLGAGMQASAEVLLGTRSVLEYLLSPVRKAWHEAGRER